MRHAAVLLLGALLVASNAGAYRPFDGTNADVAPYHRFELEAGPVGYLREGSRHALVAPAFVGNYGVLPGSELVLEGKSELYRSADGTVLHLADTLLSFKSIVLRGALQGDSGPSIALEPGVLLPTSDDGARFGAILGAIFTLYGAPGALHLNLVPSYGRDHELDWFAGLILEGPDAWPMRPVAELLAASNYQTRAALWERSILLGAVAPLTEDYSFDFAGRVGRDEGVPLDEIRVGFTWTFGPDEHAHPEETTRFRPPRFAM